MADYGYYGDGPRRGRRRRRRNVLLTVLDAVMAAATLVCSAAVAAGLFAPSTVPAGWAPTAFAGLAYPMFYTFEFMLLLYWVVRWKWAALLPAAVLAAGIGNVKLFFRPAILREYDTRKEAPADLTVMSYNVRGFSTRYASDTMSTPQLIARQLGESGAGIVCIQEYRNIAGVRKAMDSLAARLKYGRFQSYDGGDPEGRTGLAVFSAWPITGHEVIDADTAAVRAMWVDIKIKRDTLRVINCHLQNTSINDADRDFISRRGFVRDSMPRARTRDIVSRLAANYRLRAAQADSVAAAAERSPRPTLVCGDLNDTPMSYVYRTVRGPRRDAFAERGRGTSGTYYGFFNMFRIDFIFVPAELDVAGYRTGEVVLSDHSPVCVRLAFRNV